MKSHQSILPCLTGLACAVLLTGSAHAIAVSTAADFVLGFRASGGQGSGVNLEVNLGPSTNYTGLAPNTSFVVTRLSVLDLVSTYGANWDERNDLSFGIVGSVGASTFNGIPARTMWASNAETTPGTLSSPWQRSTTAAGQQNAASAIGTMYTGAVGSISNGSATANSLFSTVIDTSLAGSWTVQDDLVVGQSFRRFTPTVTISLGNIPTTPAIYDGANGYSVLDVWEMRPTAGGGDGTLVGAFGLNANGDLVFSNNPGVFAPIPEPSTALTLAVAALALTARRRRTA